MSITPIITRSEYLKRSNEGDGTLAHREYFSQFVTPQAKSCVLRVFPITTLLESKDPHLNDVGTRLDWDRVSGTYGFEHGRIGTVGPLLCVSDMLKAAGEDKTASTMTCIVKEAARQLIEEHTNQAKA